MGIFSICKHHTHFGGDYDSERRKSSYYCSKNKLGIYFSQFLPLFFKKTNNKQKST